MSRELGDYAEKGLFDHLLKNTAFPFAGQQRFFAISRADPGDNGATADEPTGEGNYARQEITGAQWLAASGRQITNAVQIDFPVLTSAINGVTHWMMFDALTGGNYLGKAELSGTPSFGVGSQPIIEAGTFIAGWDPGGLSTFAANKLLEHLMVKTEWLQGSIDLHLGVSEGSPGDDMASLAEPSSNGYARAPAGSWEDVVLGPGTTQNSAGIVFPRATGDWSAGNLTDAVLFDALSSGNGLVYGPLGTPLQIGDTERLTFPTGAIDLTVD